MNWPMDFDWKGAAALWGAGLSTLNAIYLLLSKRPQFIFESMKESIIDSLYLGLCISNPSKRILQINRAWQIPLRGEKIGIFPAGIHDSKSFRAGTLALINNKFFLTIAPESSAHIEFTSIETNTICIIILRWHRHHWLIPPCFKLLLVTAQRAQEIAAGRYDP